MFLSVFTAHLSRKMTMGNVPFGAALKETVLVALGPNIY